MSDAMAEIRASFFVECEDLLEALQDGLETMATAKANDETVNVVFRAVHSIKGGAAAFGLDQLVDFTHAFETTLDALRSGQIAVDERVTDVLYRAADLLSDVVQAARDGTLLDQAKLDPVIGDLHTLLEPDFSETPGAQDDPGPARDSIAPTLERDPAEADTNVFTISFTPKPDFYAAGSEPLFVFGLLEDLGELEVEVGPTKTLPNLDMLTSDAALLTWSITLTTSAGREAIEDIFEFATDLCDFEFCEGLAQTTTTQTDLDDDDANPTDQEVPPSPSNAPAHTVRVDVDRIDRLVNLVGELVINQAMLSQSVNAAGYASNSPVANGLDELQHLTRNIQESVMMIRAQPVKSLFQRMGRVVREVSTSLGKDVQLVTEGDTTEIDKTVVELLADPLTHMIRNALDHGLETPDGRRRAGKSNQGTISLSAAHRSGRVIIEVADDGAGIDRSKVREIAEQKGLVDPQHNLSEAEIDSLLFMPGFSTSETVSNLSGRGVGMDVVKAAISSLGGRITISSTPGLGTRFSISLPLTLAVLDGMVVRVGDETIVVPLNTIAETLSIKAGDVRQLSQATNVLIVRDTLVPLFDLGAELGYRAPKSDFTGCVALLLTQDDLITAAIIVDTIDDQRQVVIKGLERNYGQVRGIAAATILGDGQIALILDPADLIGSSANHNSPVPSLKEAG